MSSNQNPATCVNPMGLMFNILSHNSYVKGCDKWSCFPCSRKKAKRLYRRCAGEVYSYFLTITAPAGSDVTIKSVKEFNFAWKMFLQWLRRHTVAVGAYIWANELGPQSGHLHKHIMLTSTWFSYAGARACLKRVGLGVVCQFKRVRYGPRPEKSRDDDMWFSGSSEAIHYLVKYVTQDQNSYRFPKSARRVQCSSKLEKGEKQDGWRLLRLDVPLSERSLIRVLTGSTEFISSRLYPELLLAPIPLLTLRLRGKLHHDNRDTS